MTDEHQWTLTLHPDPVAIVRLEPGSRVASLLELGAGFDGELTGRENVYLNSALLGVPREETDRLFEAIVDFSELGPFIDYPVKHYSSGMYVRLGFAVAVSVVDLRQEAAGADSPRALLEEEVREVRAETDLLEDRRTLLEQEILEAQEEVLDTADGSSAERIGEYERAGYGVSLTGPGVQLTLEIDPTTHSVWTGAQSQMLDRGGRVGRFKKRYEGLVS